MRDVELLHRHLASLLVDLHVGDHADVRAHELVPHVRHAAAFHHVARLLHTSRARGPVGELGEPLQQLDAARVVQVTQPEVERVHADGRSKLVDEALVGKSVLHAARGAYP